MKFFSMILILIGGLLTAQPQQLSEDSDNKINRALILKFGINLVDSTGDKSPFNIFSDFDQMAFSNNVNFELEYKFHKLVSIAGVLSTNKWKANKVNIDGILITEDKKYLAVDSSNYNFKQEAYPVLLEIVQTMKLYPNLFLKQKAPPTVQDLMSTTDDCL